MPPLPARRPSPQQSLGDHEARIRALERVPLPTTVLPDGPKTGVYHVDAVSIASAGSSNGSLIYVRGDAVLDLTTPDAPTVVADGVYGIVGSFQGDVAATAGRGLLGLLFVNGMVDVNAYMSANDQSNSIGPNGLVVIPGAPCFAGDDMTFTLTNRDTASRSCEWVEIVVTLICGL